ncbi:MAG: peptide deformylase [Spirochaetes bacterium]|nr:peptide deformylase [Spirochaetota bacterium]
MIDIVTFGDPVLEKKAEAVAQYDKELLLFIDEMFTALEADKGIGLAAPQVGRSKRIFITELDDDKKRIFVNPEIVATSPDLVEYEEGCLSFPGLYFMVKRPASLRIQAFTEKGKSFTLEAEGLLARVILHEYDHLDGKLFIDRITPLKRERALLHFRKLLKM